MTNEDYLEMTDDELNALGLSNEKLAEILLAKGIENARVTLELNERCYQKFGRKVLSDAQTEIFQIMAKGIIPTDDEMEILSNEQITFAMESVKKARQIDIQTAAKLGEAYQPTLTLEDKTNFGIH